MYIYQIEDLRAAITDHELAEVAERVATELDMESVDHSDTDHMGPPSVATSMNTI